MSTNNSKKLFIYKICLPKPPKYAFLNIIFLIHTIVIKLLVYTSLSMFSYAAENKNMQVHDLKSRPALLINNINTW